MGLFDSFRKKNQPEDDYEYESIEQEDYEDESRLVPILKIMSEEFQPEPVESEKEFQSTLVSWLRGRFTGNQFDREFSIKGVGIPDIVIDDIFALELKIPNSKTDFRNLYAQLKEYSVYFSELSAVILVTNESLEKLAIKYSEEYEKLGVYTVILRGSKRKSRKSKNRQNNKTVNSKRKTSKKNGQKYVEIDGKAYPVASTKQNRKNKTTSKSRTYDDDYEDDYDDDYDKEQMDIPLEFVQQLFQA